LVIAAAVVAAAVIAAAFWPREKEPVYQGKKLSEWLDRYYRNSGITSNYDPAKLSEAQDAVRSMGTNAVPLLLKWMRYESPAWRKKALSAFSRRNWPLGKTLVWLVQGSRERRAVACNMAFACLGDAAAPAVPELTRVANDPSAGYTSRAALYCLRLVGRAGIPSLMGVITNSALPAGFRAEAIELFTHGVGTGPRDEFLAEPALKFALSDPDLSVRAKATNALGYLEMVRTNGVGGVHE
jgi:hypothetical protein